MTETPLANYLSQPGRSQQALANAVGLAQAAISKMLKAERNIIVVTHENGAIELREEKTIATQKTN